MGSTSAKSWTRLSDFTFTFHFHALVKEMATHSSILALENPRDRGTWWAAVSGVAQSQIRLKQLSSSSSRGKWGLSFWKYYVNGDCLQPYFFHEGVHEEHLSAVGKNEDNIDQ